MKDIQAHLDKIRSDAAECLLLSSIATDGKREVFARMAEHLNALAFELEKTLATTETNRVGTPDQKEPVAPDVIAAHPEKAAGPRRLHLLLPVIAFGAIAGAMVWANSPTAEKYWSFMSFTQAERAPSPAPQDDAKRPIATLLSDEHAERKMLTEQVGALTARLGDLERMLDTLKNARAEPQTPPPDKGSVGPEQKPPNTDSKTSAPDEKPARMEASRASTMQTPAAAKQMDSPLPATSDPIVESTDQVGAISPRRAELNPRKPAIGPAGCTQFRSFDPVSETYTTLEGRRRPCRPEAPH
jgi:hypothetical protein